MEGGKLRPPATSAAGWNIRRQELACHVRLEGLERMEWGRQLKLRSHQMATKDEGAGLVEAEAERKRTCGGGACGMALSGAGK